MKRPVTVSVVVSFYERFDHLRCCLAALGLCRQDFDEVVVTDDGSGRTTVERVERLLGTMEFTARHVWQPKDGFRVAAARNNGIRNSTGDYLVFLDSDFMVMPQTLKVHVERARPGRFVAGGCKYLSEAQTRQVFEGTVDRRMLADLDHGLPGGHLLAEHRKFVRRTLLFRLGLASPRKQSLGGHFSAFRRDIETVNGYDENFVGWGGEDEDLGIRLVQAGVYCRSAIPHATVFHLHHPRALGGEHWRQGPNIDYFRRRNRPYRCENGLTRQGGDRVP